MNNLSLKEKLINEEDNLDQFNVNFMKKLLKEVPEDTVIFKFMSGNITSKELIEGLDSSSAIATHYCGDFVRICRDILKRQTTRKTIDLNEFNVKAWVKEYKSNKNAVNDDIKLYAFFSDMNFIQIRLDLNYSDISYDLIKSFNSFFKIDKFFVDKYVNENTFCIEIKKEDIK